MQGEGATGRRNRGLLKHRARIAVLAILIALMIGCGPAAETTAPRPTVESAVQATDSAVPPSTAAFPEPEPTSPASPATETPPADRPNIEVPAGSPPVLDGVLSPGEWDGAYEDRLSDGGRLFLMQDGDYMYVAIRANGTGSGVGSLCVERGDQVSILHSSAALGTAVYTRNGGAWQKARDFQWRCRSTGDSPAAQAERAAFLEEEGWLANNGRMGVPQEVEYQIAVPGGSLRLAVAYLGPPDFDAVAWWPPGLEDDCRKPVMLQGPIPEDAHFSPETWVSTLLSGRSVPNLGDIRTRPADGMEMVYVPAIAPGQQSNP